MFAVTFLNFKNPNFANTLRLIKIMSNKFYVEHTKVPRGKNIFNNSTLNIKNSAKLGMTFSRRIRVAKNRGLSCGFRCVTAFLPAQFLNHTTRLERVTPTS